MKVQKGFKDQVRTGAASYAGMKVSSDGDILDVEPVGGSIEEARRLTGDWRKGLKEGEKVYIAETYVWDVSAEPNIETGWGPQADRADFEEDSADFEEDSADFEAEPF